MIRDFEECVDKIIIRERDFQKICKWAKSNKWMELKEQRHFFPLNTFILDFEAKGIRVYGLIELKNFNPINFHLTTDHWELTVERGVNDDGWETRFELVDGNKISNEYKAKNYASTMHALIHDILLYIEAVAKEKRHQYRISSSELRKQRDEYEYKERECYMADDIIHYAMIHPTRSSIQYRCECWGVRGHFRHLSIGKVIFIKPFKKGKKRDILEPKSKDYLIEKVVEENEREGI